MALDGLFLHKLTAQLSQELQNTRVEKIYQPSKDELVFVMRAKEGSKKLYFSAKADSARVHITNQSFLNPPNPPMLCMLLRKRFNSAWLERIVQTGFERIVVFHFTALNELGDRVSLQIICEIMGRYSNIIFTDGSGVIIDALKRVGANKSSVREILPGKNYLLPPAQDKADILKVPEEEVAAAILQHKNALLSKAILKTVMGISPLRSAELAFLAYGEDIPVYEAQSDTAPLYAALQSLKQRLLSPTSGCILYDENKPFAFSYDEIRQFGTFSRVQQFDSLSQLLDCYYENRINLVKRTQSGGELMKKINAAIEKTHRKVHLQEKELSECEDCERYKQYGELINANLYYLGEKVSNYNVFNYYTNEQIDIPADILLSPRENAAKYYREYRKKQNAKHFLNEQIAKGREQIEYLESALDILERAETPEDIQALKRELAQLGYLKFKPGKKEKAPKELPAFRYRTSAGFTVLVGRNNLSNDTLTFKTAGGSDLWFHTKNIHGSHTVLLTQGKQPEQEDIIEAAAIAAYHSKARMAENVPVDYTAIKFVKRQPSKIPGRVFYTEYKTVYVNPDEKEIEGMRE